MGPRLRRLGWAFITLLVCATFAGCGSAPDSTVVNGDAKSAAHPDLTFEGRHISRATCFALRGFLSREMGREVRDEARPQPQRFSQCNLRSSLGLVIVYMDSTIPVRKRYLSRVDGIKAGAHAPAGRLRPVHDLGEGIGGEPGAYWLASVSSLYAYSKDGWLTLLFSVKGWSNSRRRAVAVALARRSMELTVS
jgi:hypothetical protein